MKIYYMKYALTDGVSIVEVTDDGDGYFRKCERSYTPLINKKDACITLEEARKAFSLLKHKKVASLEKQLKKAKSLEMVIVDKAT